MLYLSIYLSIYLHNTSIYLHLSTYIYISTYIYLLISIYLYLSVQWVHVPMYLYIYIYIYDDYSVLYCIVAVYNIYSIYSWSIIPIVSTVQISIVHVPTYLPFRQHLIQPSVFASPLYPPYAPIMLIWINPYWYYLYKLLLFLFSSCNSLCPLSKFSKNWSSAGINLII